MRLGVIAYLVRDYDEAVAWFTEKLGFTLVEDAPLTPAKRWVVVAPPDGSCSLLLAKAEGAAQEAAVGAQAGPRSTASSISARRRAGAFFFFFTQMISLRVTPR